MPILPPIPTSPYDSVDTILNFARVIANDAGISLSGNLLSDVQPQTFPTLNLAWRKLQDRLGGNAIEDFPAELIISPVPVMSPSVISDPSAQCFISFVDFSDGANSTPVPILPPDLEIPLRVWERPTGQNTRFIEMTQSQDGLIDMPKTSLFSQWEWRDGKLYLPGSMVVEDIRIRYRRKMADIASGTDLIPIFDCAVALAYLTVEIFAMGRGSTILPAFSNEKELAIKQLINRTTRKKQRTNYRRIPYSRRGSRLN